MLIFINHFKETTVSKFHKQFNIYYLIYQSTAEAIIEQVYDQIQHV